MLGCEDTEGADESILDGVVLGFADSDGSEDGTVVGSTDTDGTDE